MRATLGFAGRDVTIDLRKPIDISVRMQFDGPQPNAFGIDRADAHPFRAGDWVGDVAQGGSVNCYVVSMCPHGNGTHTECVGHLTKQRVAICDILEDDYVLGRLVSVEPELFGYCGERYDAPNADDDLVISRRQLEDAGVEPTSALIVRTTPNPPGKAHRLWSGNRPPYLTNDAMRLIRELGVKHLLVDVPSVDREEDGGKLPNHRIFWDVLPEESEFRGVPSSHTITEMIFAPDAVADGTYVVGIQIPPWALDAAPSRIRLYNVTD